MRRDFHGSRPVWKDEDGSFDRTDATSLGEDFGDRLGRRIRRHIEIKRREPQEQIPDAPSDKVRAKSFSLE